MGMDHLLPSFLGELEKIAASKNTAGYMQTRTGRRPIRAEKLLRKETPFDAQKEEKDDGVSQPEDKEVEGGLGLSEGEGA